jgi:protein SCO1/2
MVRLRPSAVDAGRATALADEPRTERARFPLQLRAAVLVLALLVTGMAVRAAFEPGFRGEPVSGDRFDAPFALIDQHGRPFTDLALAGKPRVLFFGYTYCPDVCPTTLTALSRWIEAIGPDASRARYVFVTVDPARDRVSVLRDYLSAFSTSVVGLTGNPDDVSKMLDAYHVYRTRIPDPSGGYWMDHTATIFLVNRAGRIEDTIAHDEADASALAKIRRLVAQ